MAGQQKVAGALINLGGMYAHGIGVSQSLILAYAYFDLAVRAGEHQAHAYRVGIQKKLSTGELLEAQTLANSWVNGAFWPRTSTP
jgi:TPR repeat protein